MGRMIRLATLGAPVGGGGGGAFSPLDINGLTAWLDASDGSTLFQDAAGTTAATADGHPVGLWQDKSGNNHHVTQSTDGNRPVLHLASGVGSVLGVSNDLLTWAGASLNIFKNVSYGYVFVVIDPNKTDASRVSCMGFTTAAGAIYARLWLEEGNTAQRFSVRARRLDADSAVLITGDSNHGGTVCYLSILAEWGAGTLKLRQNGAQVASGSFAASGATSDSASSNADVFYLGTVSYGIADIYEMLIYTPTAALTENEIVQIETYMAGRLSVPFS